jgi:hypothetical protein
MKTNKFLLPTTLLFVLLSAFTFITQADKGFKPMFDGKTLNGWEGDPRYWWVEDGELIGEVTTLPKRQTHERSNR